MENWFIWAIAYKNHTFLFIRVWVLTYMPVHKNWQVDSLTGAVSYRVSQGLPNLMRNNLNLTLYVLNFSEGT